MKNINYYLAMLLMITLPVLFTSCEKKLSNDAPFEELIVGEWNCTRMDWDSEINGEKEVGSSYDDGDWIWKFNEDGELSFPWYNKPDNVTYEEDIYQYQVEGDKLYSEYAMEAHMAQYFTIESLTTDKMVLKLEYNYQHLNESGVYTFNFKRIK